MAKPRQYGTKSDPFSGPFDDPGPGPGRVFNGFFWEDASGTSMVPREIPTSGPLAGWDGYTFAHERPQPKKKVESKKGSPIFKPGWQKAIRSQGERMLGKARSELERRSEGPPQYNKSLMDFMDQAMALAQQIYGGQMDGFANREQALRDQAAEGDTALSGMYDELVQDIRGNAPRIEANYAGAISNVGDHAAGAQQSMQDGFASSREQQAALFERLGIEDALSTLAQEGNHAQGDLQAAINTSAARGQTTQDLLQQNQSSMLDFNTSTANAAGAEGTQARAALQRDLVNALASLADQRSAAQMSQQGQAFNLAQALSQDDFDRFRFNTQMGADYQARAFEQAMQEAKMAAEGVGPGYKFGQGGAAGDAALVMRQEGIPENEVGQVMRILTDLSIQNPGINQRHWYDRAYKALQEANLASSAAINAAQTYWLQNQG